MLNPDDLRIEGFYTAPPYEGRAHDGVTVTHVPSGLSAKCSSFNSLHKNRQAATIAIEVEMARRAEVALMGEPAGAEVGGSLTPCRVVDCGLVGSTMAGNGTVESPSIPKVAISYKPDYPSKNGPVVENLTGGQSV